MEDYTTSTTPASEEEKFGGQIGVKGELYLTVDKDEYRAGDEVTGRVLNTPLANPYEIGEYLYPFTFTLPAELPGVLDAQSLGGDVSSLHATIKYTLKATIKVQGRFISDLEASSDITVRANLEPPRDFHTVERTVSKALRWLGCLPRGICHLAVSMTRDVFSLGESPLVECFVNNHTAAVGVHHVKVQLLQKVTLHHPHGVADVCTRVLVEAKCPGPRAGDLLECPVQLATDGHVKFPTTTGRFLSCSYFIALECDFAALTNSVRIELPITILPPPQTFNAAATTITDLSASMASTTSVSRPQITLFG
ncbi:hypothetical protein BBJ28_00011909 [Nothophytophthora sp. Chile5]|nr:hypothetical protein BBJ28_00011909 [Nothophytophthora sp. Chile5]